MCVKIFWWDTRKISEPTEVMYLDPTKKQDITKAHAAVSLEYEPTIVSFDVVYLLLVCHPCMLAKHYCF